MTPETPLPSLYALYDAYAEAVADCDAAGAAAALADVRRRVLPGSDWAYRGEVGWVCHITPDAEVRLRIRGSDATERIPLKDFVREAQPR